jgi:UPF0271 protein
MLLNIDLGELSDEPEDLYSCAHIANIACGGHVGDAASMRKAIALCGAHGTRIGAHPSFPDREGFGRRPLPIGASALRDAVAGQCAELASVARAAGARVEFVKAHGALYHVARDDADLADALLAGAVAALGSSITWIGPPVGALASGAARARLAYAREGFADRATRPDGTLVPRGEPGALLLDPHAAADRARELARSGQVDTICVHGDTPGAAAIARAVRAAIDSTSQSPPGSRVGEDGLPERGRSSGRA